MPRGCFDDTRAHLLLESYASPPSLKLLESLSASCYLAAGLSNLYFLMVLICLCSFCSSLFQGKGIPLSKICILGRAVLICHIFETPFIFMQSLQPFTYHSSVFGMERVSTLQASDILAEPKSIDLNLSNWLLPQLQHRGCHLNCNH